MKKSILVLGAFAGLFAALVLAQGAGAVSPAKESPLLERSLQYERVLTTPTGFSPEQRRLLALTLAAAESQTTDPAELLAVSQQLDALVTYLLMSDTSYTWDGAQWVNAHRTTYAYGSGHRLAEEIKEDWDGGQWVNSSKQTYTYDGDGRLSTSVSQDWQTDHWVDEYLYSYTYDVGGNMIEILGQSWDGGGWVNAIRISLTYSGGRLATSTSEYWLVSDWVYTSKTTYTYNVGGDLTETLMQSWSGIEWIDQTLITSTYDGSGRETQAVTQAWQVDHWVNQYKSDYSYDGADHEILRVKSDWISNDWAAQDADTSKYAGDELVEEVHYSIQHGSLSRTEYTHDGHGNLIEDINQNWTSGAWENGSRGVYVYVTAGVGSDRAQAPAGFALAQNYPNPFNLSTVIEYSLEHDGPVRVVVSNLLGQTVTTLVDAYQTEGAYRAVWDGRDGHGASAASGIYFFRVQTAGFEQVRKMVLLK